MNARDMFYKKGFNFSNAEEKIFAREELVYNVTEDLLVILEDMDITKKELAKRLGKSRSYVTQILSGSRNMTLGSFSDICFALGFKPEIKLPIQEKTEHAIDFLDDEKWVPQIKEINSRSETIRSSTNVIDCRDPVHWKKVA